MLAVKETLIFCGIEDFFEAPLIVTLTTWKKRDKYVIKMLENLKQQTKKPESNIETSAQLQNTSSTAQSGNTGKTAQLGTN